MAAGCASKPTQMAEVRQSVASAEKSAASATISEWRFMDCMKAYAADHMDAKQDTQNLADIALASCRAPLNAYIELRKMYHEQMDMGDAKSGARAEFLRHQSAARANEETQELIERGRQAVIQALTDSTPAPPPPEQE
ncbi:MAG: hypothetical protein A2V90_02215 [Gammaproteobacteria bacterium RBG_16_57_12]|nr:MAG: hypothetical protein A2V90_02215 [Gammaproteobacteria bacterium RBG_16_57_12]